MNAMTPKMKYNKKQNITYQTSLPAGLFYPQT
jgi:hypothetical protein